MQTYNYTKAFEWILKDKYRIAFHLLFWIIMYLDEFLALLGITDPFKPEYVNLILLEIALDISMVYLNFYVLIPLFLLKNKFWTYVASSAASVVLVSWLSHLIFCFCFEEGGTSHSLTVIVGGTFIPTLTLLGTAVAVKIFKIFLREQDRVGEMERSSLETELAYLKDQINPHSLFNALNNIYVQCRKRPEEASESVLLLSDLLRYQLYDCTKNRVYLKGEIDYLKNYLKLDALRKSKTKIEFKVEGNPNRKMVAPFVFLPFIENAVKHGASFDNDSFINITMNIGENDIEFRIENSIPAQKNKIPKGGIGLTNVKRRLELLYPDKHDLNIKEEDRLFSVEVLLKD